MAAWSCRAAGHRSVFVLPSSIDWPVCKQYADIVLAEKWVSPHIFFD
jgi:hypothetical protein